MLKFLSFNSAYPITQMKGSQDRITSCTTTQFDGVISVIDPDNSWVARWQRTGPFVFFFSFLCKALTYKFQRNMSVGYMLFALLDAYQKTLSSNLKEEISNIALEIKLTRIRDASAFELATKLHLRHPVLTLSCTLLGMCRKI